VERKKHPLYATWNEMRKRCLSKKCRSYPYYGGRGITICQRWSDFLAFAEDMGERPPGMSIDRIDNNGNYERSNCRWATASQQQRNKGNNKMLTFNGETMCMIEWAKRIGINRTGLAYRIRRFGMANVAKCLAPSARAPP